mgnify:CR=1 FL=1
MRLSAPNTPCNISVPAGALSDAVGEPTAASNMLVAVWDQQGPQVGGRVGGQVGEQRASTVRRGNRGTPSSRGADRQAAALTAGAQPRKGGMQEEPRARSNTPSHRPPSPPTPSSTHAAQPVIKQLGKYATTEQPRFPLFIDFGERVLTTNPLRLFQSTGIGRSGVGGGAGAPPGDHARAGAWLRSRERRPSEWWALARAARRSL